LNPSKWKSFASAADEREYLALLSFLPLNKYRAIPRFIKYTAEIESQLSESRGLIGYSLQAQILSLRFWTLSVWEDEGALMEFVVKTPHGPVMQSMLPHMGATKFTRWSIKGANLPPGWSDAKKRMAQE